MTQTQPAGLAHARKCREDLDKCPVCRGLIALHAGMTPGDLSKTLEDIRAPRMRVSMAAVAVDALIERTNHSSKRATADVVAAMGVLKWYESMGGRL